jgi:predicted RNase H-like nuclease
VLIALHWRIKSRDESVLLGDFDTGYMVAPAIPEVRARLRSAAQKYAVAMNGVVPNSTAAPSGPYEMS